MRRSIVLVVAVLGCAAPDAAEVRPAAPPAPTVVRNVEMLRVDAPTRARWAAVHAPGLEGSGPAAVPADERRLRAAAHSAAAEIPMRAGVSR